MRHRQRTSPSTSVGRDGKLVGVQHFQVPAGHADKLIEALTGIYAAEVGDLKRRLANLESYNEKD